MNTSGFFIYTDSISYPKYALEAASDGSYVSMAFGWGSDGSHERFVITKNTSGVTMDYRGSVSDGGAHHGISFTGTAAPTLY